MLCADNRIQPYCVQWCVDASPWWLVSPALCIPQLPALETKWSFRGWQPFASYTRMPASSPSPWYMRRCWSVIFCKVCWLFPAGPCLSFHFHVSEKSVFFISSVQSLSYVWLFASPWTAAWQASLSITNSQSLLKLMSIESVMASNHLILCHHLLLLSSIFPSIRAFSNESVLRIRWPKYSASVLPMNIQDWFPLGLTGWISLQSKGLSRVFSNTTIQNHQLFGAQLSL